VVRVNVSDYILNGYHGKSSVLKRMVGMMLWWRTWASLFVVLVGLTAVSTVFGTTDAFWGFSIGILVATIASGVGSR